MQFTPDWSKTGVIIVDPQIDLLSSQGAAWDLFGEQVEELGVVSKLRDMRDSAEVAGVPVFYSRIEISAEQYADWQSRNGIQKLFAERRLMQAGEGARFLPELAPTDKTEILDARQGPSTLHNDVADRLRARGIETIVVAGMVANLCVESQVREAVDDGFNVIVVGDAIATLSEEAHKATLANFGLLATEVVTASEVIGSLSQGVGAAGVA